MTVEINKKKKNDKGRKFVKMDVYRGWWHGWRDIPTI